MRVAVAIELSEVDPGFRTSGAESLDGFDRRGDVVSSGSCGLPTGCGSPAIDEVVRDCRT